MSLLDNPALNIRQPAAFSARSLVRVRFLPTSSFAADLGIPPDAEGNVCACYAQDGRKLLYIQVVGVGYASGVPAEEVARLS